MAMDDNRRTVVMSVVGIVLVVVGVLLEGVSSGPRFLGAILANLGIVLLVMLAWSRSGRMDRGATRASTTSDATTNRSA